MVCNSIFKCEKLKNFILQSNAKQFFSHKIYNTTRVDNNNIIILIIRAERFFSKDLTYVTNFALFSDLSVFRTTFKQKELQRYVTTIIMIKDAFLF